MPDYCTICHGPAAPGTYACEGCVWTTRSMLVQLRRELPLLEACLAPDAGPRTGRTTPAGLAHAPVPVRMDAMNLLGPGHWSNDADVPVGPLLYGWADVVARQLGFHAERSADGHPVIERWCDSPAVRGHGPAAWITWLHAYVPLAATRPWIVALHDQVEGVLRRVRAITHTTVRTRSKTAPCPECAAFGLIERDDEWHITCQGCGYRLTPDVYLAHASAVMPGLYRTALLLAAAQAAPPAA